jgi:hypothetical protein
MPKKTRKAAAPKGRKVASGKAGKAGRAKARKVPDTKSRAADWDAQAAQLRIAFAAHVKNAAMQEEVARVAATLGQQWGLDIARLTVMGRDAFLEAGKAARAAAGDR